MSDRGNVRLPILHTPPAPPDKFPLNSLVLLRNAPTGQAGRVRGVARNGRIILVRWPDMLRLCQHKAESLVLVAGDQEHRTDRTESPAGASAGPQPYQRVRQKPQEAKHA